MLIEYHGHDEFLLTLDDGFTILFDPYNDQVGYPTPVLQADVTLATHHHFDHHAVERVASSTRVTDTLIAVYRGGDCRRVASPTRVIDTPGVHTLAANAKVTAIQVDHDPERGTLRGKTLIFRLETEGLTLVHFGDLGVNLANAAPEQVDFDLAAARRHISHADIWLLPVGGHYTIDAAAALQMAAAFEPRIVIPMHYRTEVNPTWPIAPPDAFLSGRPGWETCALLRVTKDDLPCQPHTVLLSHAAS